MPIAKEDKILIKNLFVLEGYNAKQLVSFPAKAGTYAASTCCCKSWVSQVLSQQWQMMQSPHS